MSTIYITETGDPVLKKDGKPILISGDKKKKQSIRHIFTTRKGSDFFLQEYGMDLELAVRYGHIEEVMRIVATETLNPEFIQGVNKLNYVKVKNEKNDGGKTISRISFSMTFDDGTIYEDAYIWENDE